jgi:hypothetical protein
MSITEAHRGGGAHVRVATDGMAAAGWAWAAGDGRPSTGDRRRRRGWWWSTDEGAGSQRQAAASQGHPRRRGAAGRARPGRQRHASREAMAQEMDGGSIGGVSVE